jgi:hypothetical protein
MALGVDIDLKLYLYRLADGPFGGIIPKADRLTGFIDAP